MPSYKIAIIVSEFNREITEALLSGAQQALLARGLSIPETDIFWVPGAFELPFMAQCVAQTKKYDGLIILGAVIRGETSHFELVATECTRGIQQVMLQEKIPLSYMVLATENRAQALARAGGAKGNKGAEAAEVVCTMLERVAAMNAAVAI